MSSNCIGIIKSVQDFIKEIKLLNMGVDNETKLFYRGQNDSAFDLAPSVFRDGRLEHENKIFNEIIVNCPEEFSNHKSPFEKLTKMQHYDLPTRLLDITSNPLVSLYFACQPRKVEKTVLDIITEDQEWYETNTDLKELKNRLARFTKSEDTDGEIFVWIDSPLSHDDPKVNVLAELARSCRKGTQLSDFTNEINRFIIEDMTEKEVSAIFKDFSYLTVVSSLDNNRIKRQSGAFILFGMVYNQFSDNLYSCKTAPFHIRKKNIELTISARNALIEKLKIQIAEDRSEEIDEDMKEYIISQNRITDNLKFSYLIPAERKKYILEELDKLGISQKTLFPEIDHQAKYIVNSLESNNMTIPEIDKLIYAVSDLERATEQTTEDKIRAIEDKKNTKTPIRSTVTKFDTVIKNICESLGMNSKETKEVVANFSDSSELFSAPDWYKFDSQKASYRLFIKKYFINKGKEIGASEVASHQIVDKLVELEYTKGR